MNTLLRKRVLEKLLSEDAQNGHRLREIVVYIPKFERYKKVRSKVRAHNPEWINAENDIVKIGETHKISKTKAFIVTEIVGHARADVTHEDTEKTKAAKTHAKPTEETA